MDQEEIGKVVLAYLDKRGFKQEGLALQQEKQQNSKGSNASSTAQIDPDIAKQILSLPLSTSVIINHAMETEILQFGDVDVDGDEITIIYSTPPSLIKSGATKSDAISVETYRPTPKSPSISTTSSKSPPPPSQSARAASTEANRPTPIPTATTSSHSASPSSAKYAPARSQSATRSRSTAATTPTARDASPITLRRGCRRATPPSAAPSPIAIDTKPLLSEQIFRPHRRPRFLRRASSRSRAMHEPSVRVREAAADQIEERQWLGVVRSRY